MYKHPVELEQKRLSFIGLSIHQINDKSVLIDYLVNVVDNNLTKVLYGHSLWTISVLKQNPDAWYYGEQADLLVSDGRPFHLLAKWHGLPLKFEISIPNLVFLCLDLANQNKWSVFLLGAESYVNIDAQQNLRMKYKNMKSVSGINGFFGKQEMEEVKKAINNFNPDILLIGLPSPQKERLAIEWKKDLNTRLIIPCGGMIDVLGGKTKITPMFIKKLGLASLYRFMQEPVRLFKRTFNLYYFIMFRFLPIYLYHSLIKNKSDFSILDHYLANYESYSAEK
jgi:N-acetylglucosaminyldiphosphoundecaprenol N-acetyl-beta-D-mannosaminyltransferase